MDIQTSAVTLQSLAAINIILGKNGVGKSNLLREIDRHYQGDPAFFLKYISPERGGELSFNASVEQNIRNANWALDARRRNRVDDFRHMSFAEYKNLETLILRKRERDASAPSFDDTLRKINSVLQNVRIQSGPRVATDVGRQSAEGGDAEQW